eukprot:scaffold152599_cov17-Tisochrysis_lutea.AAC.1
MAGTLACEYPGPSHGPAHEEGVGLYLGRACIQAYTQRWAGHGSVVQELQQEGLLRKDGEKVGKCAARAATV